MYFNKRITDETQKRMVNALAFGQGGNAGSIPKPETSAITDVAHGWQALALPPHMYDAMRRYVIDHHPPGGFLRALMENDLLLALAKADTENAIALTRWGQFLYNYCPPDCYGSPAAVEAWIMQEGE